MLREPAHVAVVGASGGIGRALLDAFVARPNIACVHATAFSGSLSDVTDKRVRCSTLDVRDDSAVQHWLAGIDQLDWLINTVGMLHDDSSGPEKSIRHFNAAHFERSIAINTLPSLLLAQHAEALLKRSDAGVFASVSARVGSIEDNRLGGWISYRASKSALNMALKCLSIEWQRSAKGIRVLALHPGTTDTRLSAPFQAAVPSGKLFTPRKTAALLLDLIEDAHAHPSGRFIDYAGEAIAW